MKTIIDQSKRDARLKILSKDSKRMSVRILRLLAKSPLTNSQLWDIIWPGKTFKSASAKMKVMSMTVGRVRNSFMGLLVTSAKPPQSQPGELLWTITADGIDYLTTYDIDPAFIIKCERDARPWLQDAGRRADTTEAIARRAVVNQGLVQELSAMNEYGERGTSCSLGEHAQLVDIWSVYAALVNRRPRGAYRISMGGRRRLP